jgi:hypothetical protein
MNLVIDDAVEVKQATKTEGESRRELGTAISCLAFTFKVSRLDRLKKFHRTNPLEGRQRLIDTKLTRMSRCRVILTKACPDINGYFGIHDEHVA